MKQPDTAALRERLANYTPEDELGQDKQELEGLLQEVNYQLIEFRNLMKEINALKEELHDIHGSLKQYCPTGADGFQCLGCSKGQRRQYRGRHQPSYCQSRTEYLSSVLQSAPKNWRKCINVPPPISKPRRNYWKNIVKS